MLLNVLINQIYNLSNVRILIEFSVSSDFFPSFVCLLIHFASQNKSYIENNIFHRFNNQ